MLEKLQALRARLKREQTALVSLIAAYIISGLLGLWLGYVHPATSLVWPPAGIALAAFLVQGYRVWPAVLVSAIVVYAASVGPVAAVIPMSLGNTVEGLLAAYLINRYAGGRHALQTPQNSFRFAGLTALSSLSISATCGALSLTSTGLALWADYGAIWVTWALGNFASYILVGSTVMLWGLGAKTRWSTAMTVEAVAFFLALLLVGFVVFLGFPSAFRGYPLELLCGPILLWSAFRLGRRAAMAGVLLLTGLAIYGTLSGFGPFVRATPTASMTMVLLFMNLTAIMALTLAALTSEYSVAEAQLRELVVTDPLTGLPNYRRLVEVLGTEITRSNRTGSPVCGRLLRHGRVEEHQRRARASDRKPGRLPVRRNTSRLLPRDRHRCAIRRRRVRGLPSRYRRGRRKGRDSPDGRAPDGRHGQTGTLGKCRRRDLSARRRYTDHAPQRGRPGPLRRQGGQGGRTPPGRRRDPRME